MSAAAPDLFAHSLQTRLDTLLDPVLPELKLRETKEALRATQALLFEGFDAGLTAAALVEARARTVDRVLRAVWSRHLGEQTSSLALIAVGGYGRGELLPHSDVDLMILYRDPLGGSEGNVQDFLTLLWDLGLEVGHSVRTPEDCAQQAAGDITVMTNLLEARLLAGDDTLFAEMQAAIAPAQIWPTREFFKAKLAEQRARHRKYDDTGYKLESNVKESPGGLRDIQTIVWVAKRHFDAHTLYGLVEHGFLTDEEYQVLDRGQDFLWRVRFALHMLTGRREDRLLFDHQIKLAKLFGFADQKHNLAVEQFMQRYYRTIKSLSALNDLLLQLFDEAILHPQDDEPPKPINRRFQIRHGFIEVTHPEVFRENRFALFEIFHLMQQNPRIDGIRAETLRLLRRDRHLIDESFRQDIRAKSLFMEILRTGNGLTRALRRMNRYGLLGRYLPAFGLIIGRMQYDLFHTLTVDEHTLFVVRNMRRLAMKRFQHELPFCSDVMAKLPKPELLYLAGLFHDIAKGRGGDHAQLGADDAMEFCLAHGLSSRDASLVSWLVRHHLVMSVTAQKKDVSDPVVVHEFAQLVGDRQHLDYLFVQTVSDIRGTNPKLWNSWRENLLTALHKSTARALDRGLDTPIAEAELVRETQDEARASLHGELVNDAQIESVWSRCAPDFFRRYSAAEVAWITRGILRAREDDLPLVLVDLHSEKGCAVFVYARDVDYLFGLMTAALAQSGLSILDARIAATRDHYTLDTYIVTESDGDPVSEPSRVEEIRAVLKDAIRCNLVPAAVTRKTSRIVRNFMVPTQVHFEQDRDHPRTIMELVTADRPGLLAVVGAAFRKHGVLVEDAKVATIGERVEDVFIVTNRGHAALDDRATLHALREDLTRALDHENAA